MEALLPGGIPYLQPYTVPGDLHGASAKITAYSGVALVGEAVVDKAPEETGLTHSGLA